MLTFPETSEQISGRYEQAPPHRVQKYPQHPPPTGPGHPPNHPPAYNNSYHNAPPSAPHPQNK